jgi:NAD(P)-dependent dehydrogenase (short-subunit alcohol dehydrogenase family)
VIDNTAPIGGLRPRPNVTIYNATKVAVITLTRGLATVVAPFKIRVNAVNPVAAETGFMLGATGHATLSDAARKALNAGIPTKTDGESRYRHTKISRSMFAAAAASETCGSGTMTCWRRRMFSAEVAPAP